jgi:branched-subunit amino acid ABC-type transport system permease component
MEFFTISMLNGLSYGLLLFMLSSGLTLIFSMMGVLNFAHASFYMVGAYVAYTIARVVGFWPGLILAPLVVAALGAAFEKFCLRRVHKFGHVPELLITSSSSRLRRCAGRLSRWSRRRSTACTFSGAQRRRRCAPRPMRRCASSARRSRPRAAS